MVWAVVGVGILLGLALGVAVPAALSTDSDGAAPEQVAASVEATS